MAQITLKNKLFKDNSGLEVRVTAETVASVELTDIKLGTATAMSREAFLTAFKPARDEAYHLVKVTGDWLPEGSAYEAYSNGATWNGFVSPYFTLEAGIKLMAEMPNLSFSRLHDAFIATDEDAPPGEEDTAYKAETLEVDSKLVTVYPIGASFWCWTLDEESDSFSG